MIQQEELVSGFVLTDLAVVLVTVEEEIASFLRSKVEEAEGTTMRQYISHEQTKQTVMN